MHEHAIVHDLVDAAQAQGKVRAIHVEVGALAPIAANELAAALSVEKPSWIIAVAEKPAQVKCGKCGFSGQPKITERAHDFVLFECAKCGAIPQVLSGKEIALKKVSVD
ncbi:MAG: hydrogenase/urease maturation nickel metallochaperone HypA [Candidatus Micrarchaeia archaeon]|jgi:Zn finger protein HypA/HybF involved in hydrogenase expression